MNSVTGTVIKGYELHNQIGSGGFGTVYMAHQTTIERDVAIKIIKPCFASQPEFIRRFETEARLVARLEHPFIVPLYDYWRNPDGAYLVMRYFRGGNLRDALEDGAFGLESIARFIEQVASALAVAHRNNIIHRDLKPENILLDEDGNYYLADFGIAKDVTLDSDENTSLDQIKGTPGYLSPEQARSEAVTPCTDIYSLGVLLYEILTGEHPFPNLSGVERLYKHLNEPFPVIETTDTPSLEGINDIIQHATAKNPTYRYADVLELAADVRDLIAQEPGTSAASIVELLTMREQEVLQHMIAGKSNREISEALFITVDTVRWYLKQIYKKLRVRSRVQAIARARELHLVVNANELDEDNATVLGESDSVTLYLPDAYNPYKGLHAFQSSDTQDFFGRERITEKLIWRLGETGNLARFLAVVGPSGSGKSSLVKAGLIPTLWRGDLPGSDRWFFVEMMPGSRPLDELEVALLRVAANQGINLREQLNRDSHGLLRVAQLILPDDGSELVLVIDQFEEIFTLVEDEADRLHFLNLVHAAVTDIRSRLRIVITLRADFYDRPLAYPEFGALIRDRMETILPLSAKELERAILNPAQRVGVHFEEGLAATIVSDVSYQPGALPLLQYALTELFEQRDKRTLTHEAYQRIGGAVGALAKRAEDMFNELSDEGQEIARQIFLRLVTLGEGVEDTRRRTYRSELEAITDDVDLLMEIIDSFAAARLLSMDHDPATRAPTVELAHEAILREWDRMRRWINESREEIRFQRQLARMAEEWRSADCDSSFLLREARLEQFQAWAEQTELAITEGERSFLNTSIAEHKRQVAEECERQEREAALERRSIRSLRWLVTVFAGATVIAVVLLALLGNALRDVATQRDRAEDQTRLAVSRELSAASINNLDEDTELSILLALQALSEVQPLDAVNALHRALPAFNLLQVLEGHSNLVHDIAYNADGTRLASVSWDGTVMIWDVASGEPLLAFEGHGGTFAQGVAFSPDGERIVTGGGDNTARVWDVSTGEEILVLEGHTPTQVKWMSGVITVAFAPQEPLIATGGADGMVILWDAITGDVKQRMDSGEGVVGVTFSPDGTCLASSGFSGIIKIWEVDSGQESLSWTDGNSWVTGLAFSPDGMHLATSNVDGVSRIWDATSGELIMPLTGHKSQVDGIAFSPDGTRVATASYDGTAKIWDVNTGQELFTLAGHHGNAQEVAFSPGGPYLATSSMDGIIRIWSTQSGREVLNLVEIEPNGRVFYNADGSRIITGGDYNPIFMWDSVSGEVLLSWEPDCAVDENLYLNQDRTQAAYECLNDDPEATDIEVMDLVTGDILFSFSVPTGREGGISFSPDGTRLAASVNQTTIVWDLTTGAELFVLEEHEDMIWGTTFSPDGTQLATAAHDGTAVWDAASGQQLAVFYEPGANYYSAAFSPDGTHLAASRGDGIATVWNLETGALVHTLTGHSAVVYGTTYSPDGTRIGTVSFDGTAKVWDAESGEEIATLYGSTGMLFSIDFSPDSKHVVIAGFDDNTRIYTVDLDELIAIAQARVTRTLTTDECQRYLHQEECPSDALHER